MDDTTPRLPGLSKLKESELRERYVTELGQEVPEELTTTEQLREAISAHRAASEPTATDTQAAAPTDTAPATTAKADAPLKAGPGEILAEKDGEQRVFTAESWETIKASRYGWKQAADATKPPML